MLHKDWAALPLATFLSDCYFRQNLRVSAGSPRTRQEYRVQVSLLTQFFARRQSAAGETPQPLTLRDLTGELISACMADQLARGKSAATANKLRRTIKALHKFAYDSLEIDLPPLRGNMPLREPKRKPQAWSPEDVRAILAACEQLSGDVGPWPASLWFRALVLVAINTGCRITSIMLCPSSGFVASRGMLTIPAEVQKHGADETFDLLPPTRDALAAILPHRRPLIFGDWPLDRSTARDRNNWRCLTRVLRRLIVAAKLADSEKQVSPKDLWHKFRRTFGSWICKAGGRAEAQERLGHSSPQVTARYLDPEYKQGPKLVELLGELSRPAPAKKKSAEKSASVKVDARPRKSRGGKQAES